MRKVDLKERIRYKISQIMEKGTATMIAMLLLFTTLASAIVGLIVYFVCGGTADERIWASLMHTLDAGNLAGDEFEDKINIVFMTFMTVFGLFFTSVLIGVINNSFEEKIYDMRKGKARVLEEDHVVILGYNYTTFTLLESLIEANMVVIGNEKEDRKTKRCIVVVGDEKHEVMKDAIDAHIKDRQKTKIICRSGKTYEDSSLRFANIENARSVIINGRDDFHAIKTLLAFKSYIKDKELKHNDLFASVVIQDKKYVEAAEHVAIVRNDNGVGEKRIAEVIYGKDAISRIIAHSCNQRGLCSVFEELINYADNELYCEDVPDWMLTETVCFEDIRHSFESQIPIGLIKEDKEQMRGKGFLINPLGVRIEKGDKLIVFEQDNDSIKRYEKEPEIDDSQIERNQAVNKKMMDLVVLGQNDRLNDILTEYDKIADKEAVVTIADTSPERKYVLNEYANISVNYKTISDFGIENLRSLLNTGREFNVLVLTNDELQYEDADSETMIKLITLNRLKGELDNAKGFATTCEIRKSSNQKLASTIGGDNFVVSSNITSLLATQVSENRILSDVFKEILSIDGYELYMRPIDSYVKIDSGDVSFDTIIEAAFEKNCIALGFRKASEADNEKNGIVTCPEKGKKLHFEKEDTLIVLAES